MDNMFQGTFVNSNRILYTASAFAKSSLLHLQETGNLHAQKPHTSRRAHLSSFLFFVVTSGSGELVYDDNTYQIKAGDCIFIDCRKPYSHTTSKDLWSLKWIHFYGPNMNSIYAKFMERGGKPVFTPSKADRYESIVDEIFSLADSEDYLRDMKIYQSLTVLLTYLMEDSWNPEESRRSSLKRQNLQEIKDYLDTHYTERIVLDDLAEHFYINKFYLTRIFKEQFGMPINSYLMQLRITHSKQLLRFSDKTIEEIAIECGMSDANYFSRAFKKVEGITPSAYRESW